MHEDRRRAIVVGAGVPGLVAAAWLHERGWDVHAFDRASSPGGLFRSVQHGGMPFDLGTRFIQWTGDPEIDRIQDAALPHPACHVLRGSLAEGHVIDGRVVTMTGCPDLRRMDLRHRMAAILASGRRRTAATAEAALHQRYGRHVGGKLAGILSHHAGVPARGLAPRVIADLHLQRVVMVGAPLASLLKRFPSWDTHLAWPRAAMAHSQVEKRYPRAGSMGAWTDGLANLIPEDRLHLDASIEALDEDRRQVLVSQRWWNYDLLLWTLPAAALTGLRGRKNGSMPPLRRDVHIGHFSMSEPPRSNNLWVTNYDPELPWYRVTLYANFVPEHPLRMSIEVLANAGERVDFPDSILSLRELGILGDASSLQLQGHDVLPGALNLATPASEAARQANLQAAAADRIVLAGPDAVDHGGLVGRLRAIAAQLRKFDASA